MANSRDIRDRIASIKNTQKITRAMKMVAAAKVKKSELQAKANRPFSAELGKMFYRILSSVGEYTTQGLKTQRAIDNYPKLLEKRETKTVGLLLISSNKGLAGAYNANLVKYCTNLIKKYTEENVKVKLIVVGQKGLNGLKPVQRKYNFEIIKSYTNLPQNPNSSFATILAEDLADLYLANDIDKIQIVTTRFKNMMSYNTEDWTILPLEIDKEKISENKNIDTQMEFEPNAQSILQKLIPMFLTNTILQALFEANASELASRMTAMSAATDNAGKMIQNLSIEYNKARQAAITNELSEIVAGADALNN
ncbi:ATP synthase F1 subunit gamma [bacterium]|nr:ATP synthase F1 subunit gamma [bacterium]